MLSMASPIIFRCTFFFFPFHIVFALVEIMKVVSRPISYFHIWCLSSGEHGDYMQLCKYNCSPPVNLHDWLQVRKFCQQRVTYSTLSLSTSFSDETIIFGTYAVALSHCTVNLCEWYMVTNFARLLGIFFVKLPISGLFEYFQTRSVGAPPEPDF